MTLCSQQFVCVAVVEAAAPDVALFVPPVAPLDGPHAAPAAAPPAVAPPEVLMISSFLAGEMN